MPVTDAYILTIAVPFIVSILALAFPLVLDASSKISSQYKSSFMAKIFQREFAFRWFVAMLVLSIVAIILYACKIPVANRFVDNWFIANSAVLLVYTSSALLVVALLVLAIVIAMYYDQGKLIKYFVLRYKITGRCKMFANWLCFWRKGQKFDQDTGVAIFDKNIFTAVSKLMNFSINEADEKLARDIFTFYTEAFVAYRNGKKGQKVVYPEEFYNSVFEANELLCIRRKKTVSYYNDGTLYDFFIDSFQDTLLSDKTRHFMWMCVIQNMNYRKEDFIFSLWKKIFQHVSLFLSNKVGMEKEKETYIEFAQVLCSFVLYSSKYELLYKMLSYSQMSPHKYVLTPSSTQEVIDECLKVQYHHTDYQSPHYPVYFEYYYSQPDTDGVDGETKIESRLYDFYAVSFLWQYNLDQTYLTRGYMDNIYQGNAVEDKKDNLECLQILRYAVEEVCKNQQLLKSLKLDGLSYNNSYRFNKSPEKWFDDNINALIQGIASQEDVEERAAEVTQEVVDKYNEEVSNTCGVLFQEVQRYFPTTNNSSKTASFFLTERCDVERKSHVLLSTNFAETMGGLLANDYSVNMWLPLLNMNVHRFLLEEDDAVRAALGWWKRKDLIIFNFGVWINETKYIEDGLLIKKGEKLYTKNDIEIITVDGYKHPSLIHSFVIVKRSDLPYIEFNSVDQSLINELGLQLIDADNKVYTSVIDFNKPRWASLKTRFVRNHPGEEEKYAMFYAKVNTSLKYNPNAKVVQLNIYNQFQNRTSPQNLSDVFDVWKKSLKNKERELIIETQIITP